MLKIADRIRETTTTAGTGDITLAGAVAGYGTLSSVLSNGDAAPYCIVAGAEWEVGVGTYSAGVLTRTTVLASSASGAAVSFSAGAKDVFITLPAVAAAGGLLPVPFATSIGFQASAQMPQQTVAGALAFSADPTGARDGVEVLVDLIANGTNTPTFSTPLIEWDGSSGYVNTNGVRNCITFFRRNGKSYYSINQALGAPVEPIAPGATTGLTDGAKTSSTIALSWTAPTTGTLLTYTVGYRLTSAGGAYSTATSGLSATTYNVTGLAESTAYDFRVFASNAAGDGTAATIGNISTTAALAAPGPVVSLAAGTATTTTQPLTWSAPVTGGGSITDYKVEYKASSSGTWLTFSDAVSATTGATVTGLSASTAYDYRVSAFNGTYGTVSTITNINTAAPANVLRAGSLTMLTESGDATAGWNYTTASATWAASKSIVDKSLPAATDGWIQFVVGHTPASDKGFGLGFRIDNSAAALYNQVVYGITGNSSYGKITLAGVFGSLDTARSVAAGDWVRYERAGTTLTLKISSDGGSTFATINTITGVGTTGNWYFSLFGDGTGAIMQNIRHSGFV